MPKGFKAGGRKKGTPNKASVKLVEQIAATGLTPLEYMLDTLRDKTKDDPIRMDAAKSAAPYIHPKLAAMELSGPGKGAIEVKDITAIDFARRAAFLFAQAEKELNKEE